jgi:hypothetical protein
MGLLGDFSFWSPWSPLGLSNPHDFKSWIHQCPSILAHAHLYIYIFKYNPSFWSLCEISYRCGVNPSNSNIMINHNQSFSIHQFNLHPSFWNFNFASLSSGFLSGWNRKDRFRYARLMSSALALRETPSILESPNLRVPDPKQITWFAIKLVTVHNTYTPSCHINTYTPIYCKSNSNILK